MKSKFQIIYSFLAIGIFVFLAFGSVDEGEESQSSTNDEQKIENKSTKDPLSIGEPNVKALVGQKVPYDKWSEWGAPQTIEGTDNKYWVAYLESANISFVSEKSTDVVIYAGFDKNSATVFLSNMIKERKILIEKQFSSWDGSHRILSKAIKKVMNDPSSFEHVETVYIDMGDHLIVTTKYRGKNAFGGKVLGMVKAKVNLDGQVLEILEQR